MAIDRTDTSGAQWYELSEDGVRLLDWRRGEWRWEPLAHAPAPAPDR
jgi:hypothetical protein